MRFSKIEIIVIFKPWDWMKTIISSSVMLSLSKVVEIVGNETLVSVPDDDPDDDPEDDPDVRFWCRIFRSSSLRTYAGFIPLWRHLLNRQNLQLFQDLESISH